MEIAEAVNTRPSTECVYCAFSSAQAWREEMSCHASPHRPQSWLGATNCSRCPTDSSSGGQRPWDGSAAMHSRPSIRFQSLFTIAQGIALERNRAVVFAGGLQCCGTCNRRAIGCTQRLASHSAKTAARCPGGRKQALRIRAPCTTPFIAISHLHAMVWGPVAWRSRTGARAACLTF